MNQPTYDVVIIGAGPSGLAAAIYTGRAKLKTVVVEKGIPGGQILFSDWVENYPGFDEGVSPQELMKKFKNQAQRFGAFIKRDQIRKVRKRNQFWLAEGNQEQYLTRAVIVATGSVYRKLGVKGEEQFTGRGVSYCATCDGAFFKDKQVGIVGGGNHALTEALFLTKFCSLVKLIHRRSQLRAEKILEDRVAHNPKIEIMKNKVVEKISGRDKLESITLRDTRDSSTSELVLDGLFISIGMDPNSGLVKDLVEVDEKGQIKVGEGMKTSQAGIFAAGDVTNACPNQLATAAGTGVYAALSAAEYLQE